VSKYSNDPRVVLHDDGSAVLPDPGDYNGPRSGDWHVEQTKHGGYTLRNQGGDQHYVTDEGDRYSRRPKVFDSADEAIAHVIGDPVTEPCPNGTHTANTTGAGVEPGAVSRVDDDTDGM
jgi:hypothetical protein